MVPHQRAVRRARPVVRHALVGALVVTVVVVLTGVLAHTGDRAAGDRRSADGPPSSTATPGTPADSATSAAPAAPTAPAAPALGPADLLGPAALPPLRPGRTWQVSRPGTPGPGPDAVCRQAPRADAEGPAALTRGFEAVPRGELPARTAVQTVELSATRGAAGRAYRTTVGWYAGCRVGRLQLLDAHLVRGVGSRARVLTLRRDPGATYVVGIALVGRATTSVLTTSTGGPPPPPVAVAGSLASAVAGLCPVSAAHRCPHRARLLPGLPAPLGEPAGLLVPVDLPPVGQVARPWVGTRPATVHVDRPATPCDRAGFVASGASRATARTFLVPGAGLPVRFGLTETVAGLPSARRAGEALTRLRRVVAGCHLGNLATSVGPERRAAGPGRHEASAWDLTTRVPGSSPVRFRLGLVRAGSRVAELALTPVVGADMSSAAFDALLQRAGDRLAGPDRT